MRPLTHRAPNLASQFPELRVLTTLRTPERVQDFVSALPINFEPGGESCWSVVQALRRNCAHCIEGAFVAAYALWLAGEPPLLMDFQAEGDDDHVIALFRRGDCWGAISKSNHVWLRWRDPVYRTLRELAISYFHEYVNEEQKTLRRYSRAIDMRRFDPALWILREDSCWDVSEAIDSVRHYPLITARQARRLRGRDTMEMRADAMTEYARSDKANAT